jgi:hypothetical protein
LKNYLIDGLQKPLFGGRRPSFIKSFVQNLCFSTKNRFSLVHQKKEREKECSKIKRKLEKIIG